MKKRKPSKACSIVWLTSQNWGFRRECPRVFLPTSKTAFCEVSIVRNSSHKFKTAKAAKLSRCPQLWSVSFYPRPTLILTSKSKSAWWWKKGGLGRLKPTSNSLERAEKSGSFTGSNCSKSNTYCLQSDFQCRRFRLPRMQTIGYNMKIWVV